MELRALAASLGFVYTQLKLQGSGILSWRSDAVLQFLTQRWGRQPSSLLGPGSTWGAASLLQMVFCKYGAADTAAQLWQIVQEHTKETRYANVKPLKESFHSYHVMLPCNVIIFKNYI